MSEMTAIATIALTSTLVFAFIIGTLLYRMAAQQDHWHQERRFLVDRAIARHAGEILALDRADNKRENGAEPARERVQHYPEGL